jgi:hypothetical protein
MAPGRFERRGAALQPYAEPAPDAFDALRSARAALALVELAHARRLELGDQGGRDSLDHGLVQRRADAGEVAPGVVALLLFAVLAEPGVEGHVGESGFNPVSLAPFFRPNYAVLRFQEGQGGPFG